MGVQWRWILLGFAVALGTFGLLVWRYAEPDASSSLRPPPEIPALGRVEFDATPDARLLELIQAEGTRRILRAGNGWGQGQAALPDELRHLWTIGAVEADLHQMGFVHVLSLSTGPAPMLPPLADLEAAYRALGQTGLADTVRAVLAAVEARTIDGDAGRLDAAFRAAIVLPGLRAQRIAYARRNRLLLVEDGPSSGLR